MVTCPKCGAALEDGSIFCQSCGSRVSDEAPAYAQPTMYDPYDHTADFDASDISDNKVYAMLVYLLGWIGILIALLGANGSKFVQFHLRQALKIIVAQTLIGIIIALTFWTFIIPIAGVIALGVLLVVQIISFFQICAGKAKEPFIIRNLTFLK